MANNTNTQNANIQNANTHGNLTLVLGGTGKTGRRVAERLAARGVPVRIGSRSASPAFSWQDRGGWAAVLDGVTSVYVSYAPDLAVPGAADDIKAFTEAAAAAGVRRLVLLSGRGEEEAQICEGLVRESGLEWTIVRAAWFSQNFSESFLIEPLLAGEVVLPVGDVREPFVDADDIADVAVAALTEDGHVGQSYEVTGPRLLTFAQAVREIAEAAGREIPFVQISTEEYAVGAKEQGVPEDLVEFLTYLFTTVLDGRNAYQTDGVRRALGREPRDFSDFVREAAKTGVWEVA
ncbi:NAD(P)H-binding protein [Actinomadura rudentiformis]|uniref:NAD(P)H-binding protein n=1 Tax=Actinomadura rudentiformis TaxID=359158 RepID=A0A6H9YX78_9ACTN|nr:NAD(P)H-binding protein [Actinomadura rudentiformis]KAB2345641.1 NAD(P)H-binding protein [Actinomadura rudentiformis]